MVELQLQEVAPAASPWHGNNRVQWTPAVAGRDPQVMPGRGTEEGGNMLPCIESSALCGEGILETMHKSVKISGAKFDCEGGEWSVEGRDFRPLAAAAAW